MTGSPVSRAFSSPSNLLTILAVVALSACSSQTDSVKSGRALANEGAQSSGVVGTQHAKVGETWWFALPVPANTTSQPIEITDVAVLDVPHGIKVLKYGAYSKVDTEGIPLLVREGGDAPDFSRLTNHIDKPVKVAPGAESDIFYLAKLKITSPPRGSARQCRFEYRQGGQAYTQTLDCEVELKTG